MIPLNCLENQSERWRKPDIIALAVLPSMPCLFGKKRFVCTEMFGGGKMKRFGNQSGVIPLRDLEKASYRNF